MKRLTIIIPKISPFRSSTPFTTVESDSLFMLVCVNCRFLFQIFRTCDIIQMKLNVLLGSLYVSGNQCVD